MIKLKKTVLLLLALGAALMFCGCSSVKFSSVDTVLTVDQSFRGQRVMTTRLSSKDLNSLFDGDLEQLTAILGAEEFEPVECTAKLQDDGSAMMTMAISFNSYSDYFEKIKKIFSMNESLTEEEAPSVYYEYSDSFLKQGFVIEENFASEDLFFCIVQSLIPQIPQLEGKEKSDLFSNGKTTVVFEGEEIQTGNCVSITRMESNAFDFISVETVINGSGGFDMSVDYYVSQSVADAFGSRLKATMKTLVPDEGELISKKAENQMIYTINAAAVSTSDYVQKMNHMLHTEDTVFEIADESDEEDTLKARKKITQYLNGSYFLDFTDETTVMTYVLKAAPEYSFENCDSEYQFIQSCNFENSEDYCCTYVTVSPSDQITLYLGYSVDIDKIDVDTVMTNEKNFTRNIKFTLTPEQNNIIGERFEEQIKERLKENITYEKAKSGSNTVYTVTFKASGAQELSRMTCGFLDGNSDSSMSALSGGPATEDRLNKVGYDYTDKIDLSIFLSGSQSTKGLFYRFEYPKGYKGYFVENSNVENVLEDYNVLTCVTRNKVIEVGTYARKANVTGILIRVFLLLSFIGIVVVLLMNIRGIIRCIKKRRFDVLEFDLFSKRGYIFATILSVCVVVFLFSLLRLIFKIY